MPLQPDNWNVVVIGHWNRAILSPAGIAKRLFNLPDGTPVQVLVPLDVVAPYHIYHDDVTVIPSNDRLLVQPKHPKVENLVKAIAIVRRALEDLPRTPVFAAGINLGYKSDDAVEVIQQVTASPWDDRIDNKRLVIASRSIARTISWDGGNITTAITQNESGACSILLNFDFQSREAEEIRKWLHQTAEQIQAQAETILNGTIGLSPEDFGNG